MIHRPVLILTALQVQPGLRGFPHAVKGFVTVRKIDFQTEPALSSVGSRFCAALFPPCFLHGIRASLNLIISLLVPEGFLKAFRIFCPLRVILRGTQCESKLPAQFFGCSPGCPLAFRGCPLAFRSCLPLCGSCPLSFSIQPYGGAFAFGTFCRFSKFPSLLPPRTEQP